MNLRWIAISTHPHKERVAEDNLRRQGYVTYCPMLQKTVRHARTSRLVLRPLFPGYIFAGAPPDEGWRSMRATRGVRRVLCQGEHPCLLSQEFIGALRAREIDGAVIKPAHPYKIGQPVRMTGGAFDGLVATIIEADDRARLVLLLDLLNRSVRIQANMRTVREV